MKLDITDEQLLTIVSAAILEHLTPERREALLKTAILELLRRCAERSRGSRSGTTHERELETDEAGGAPRTAGAGRSSPARAWTVTAEATRAIDPPAALTEGAIAVVKVTARNLRRLGERVEALRESGALGVQLVWDGRDPSPAIAEASVFAVLERARATPGKAPVVLARSEAPVESLRILVAARGKKGQGQP